jgi:RHS repeat-associated protein
MDCRSQNASASFTLVAGRGEHQLRHHVQPYAAVTGATTATGIQYHEQDELGNVLGTHTGTSVTESISYDPWGVPSYTGTLNSRLMWKGLMWEGGPAQGDVVGLSYVRGRWYDPQPGRFIQEDPLGVDGGVNVYLYAGDDPINGFDPSGMDAGITCRTEYNYGWVNGMARGVSPKLICESSGGSYSGANDDSGMEQIGGGGGPPNQPVKKADPADDAKRSVAHCLGETAKDNGVAVALDLVSGAVSIAFPEEQLAKVAATALTRSAIQFGAEEGLAFAAITNSSLHGDTPGVVTGAVSLQLATLDAAKGGLGKTFASAIPFFGVAAAGFSLYHDLHAGYVEYKACRAGQ